MFLTDFKEDGGGGGGGAVEEENGTLFHKFNQLKIPIAPKLRTKYSTLGIHGKFSEVCRYSLGWFTTLRR